MPFGFPNYLTAHAFETMSINVTNGDDVRPFLIVVTALLSACTATSTKIKTRVLSSQRVELETSRVDQPSEVSVEARWGAGMLSTSVSSRAMCATRKVGVVREVLEERREHEVSTVAPVAAVLVGLFVGLPAFVGGLAESSEDAMPEDDEYPLGPGAGVLILAGSATIVGWYGIAASDDVEQKVRDRAPFDETGPPFACGDRAALQRPVELTVTKGGIPIVRRVIAGEAPMGDVISAGDRCGSLMMKVTPVVEANEVAAELLLSLPSPDGSSKPNPANVRAITERCCAVSSQGRFRSECVEDCRSAADANECFSGLSACEHSATNVDDAAGAKAICQDLFSECMDVKGVGVDELDRCTRMCSLTRAEQTCREGV